MKTIRRYFSNAEAEFARSLLVSVGIQATLSEENGNTLGPGYAPWGVRLQVPDEDVARSQEILKGNSEEFAPLPEDFVEPEGISEEREAQVLPPPPGLGKFGELIKAILFALVIFGVGYELYMWLAPLNWHSSRQLIHMGNEALDKKDYARALECYNTSLILNAKSSVAYYDRGLAYFHEKDYAKAIDDFTASIQIDDQHSHSYDMLGFVYYRLKKYDDALFYCNKSIKIKPDNSNYNDRGLIYAKLGDADKAIDDYQHSMALDSHDRYPMTGLAWIYATWPEKRVRDGMMAVSLAQQACELSKWTDPFCIGALAAGKAETGNFADAVKYQKQALELAPGYESVDKNDLDTMNEALTAYQQGKPYRDVIK